ncbi:hypothetical protein PV762_20675 [Mitsuaria sp. CC2]|jgi:hypothetical protein|uniref:hypothetical protein n=1 Tax=Mitsuaria sp. CC2 TaxID=3029186 RepID=UPI003B8C8564
MQHHAVNADDAGRPSAPGLLRTAARVIAASAGARLVLALPGCCAAWSYPELFLAIMGAMLWGAVVLRVTAVFLAAAVDGTRPRVSRSAVALLGLVAAAIGAEAFWALAAAAPDALAGIALEVIAGAWIACCAVLVGHRWRQPAAPDPDA